MKRRTWLTASVAAAAGVAGAGLAWWRLRPDPARPEADEAFWGQRFDTPAGNTLALSSLRGKPLVVNFWATWCPPCVKELPEIERFYRAHREQGWQVLGLAVDRAAPVRDFLRQTPLSFPIALAGFGGAELSRQLGNSAGALPFTVLIGQDARILQRKLGQTSFEELTGWAQRPV